MDGETLTVTVGNVKQKQGKVPVFNVTLGDKELGLLTGPEFTGVDLEKVQKLLEDKLYSSRQLQSFHEAALRKVTKTYSNGFLLRKCAVLGRILSICSTRFSDQPTLIPIVVELIRLCSIGLITQGTSHEAAFEKQAIYLIDELSQLVMCSSDEVRQAACHCFLKLFSSRQQTETYQGTQRCSFLYNRFIIEQSGAVARIISALKNFDLTDTTELLVIKLLQKLSKQSSVICYKLLENGAAALLVRRLAQWPYDSEPVFRTVEVIWNMHDLVVNNSAPEVSSNALAMFVDQLADTESLRPLYALFVYHLYRPHAAASRQLRNDALVLASLVAKYKPSAAFLETGFAQLLLKLATTTELGGKSVLAVANNREDFELKKLFINIVALLSRDVHARNLLSLNGIVPAFSVYVCAGAPPGKREWSEAQREEIQLHAIAALTEIVPLSPLDVIECHLATRMLLMLDWSADQSSTTSYEGSGNSFYGAGGYKSKRAQLRYCARLLLASISEEQSPGTGAVVDALVDQGAIDTILHVIRSITDQQNATKAENSYEIGSSEEALAVEIQGDLLLTLSLICSSGDPNNATHNREIFGVDGCHLLCDLLRDMPSRLSSGLGHSRLLLATLDCLWNAGIGTDLTEDALLENGSIFALLDLIQMMHEGMPAPVEPNAADDVPAWAKDDGRNEASSALAEVAMGCIVDLLDNPRSIRHLLAWRGKRSITAPHLFCEMWRKQRGIARKDEVPTSESPETVLCSRVYAIFLRLGWTDVPGLTAEDHITRPEIDHYLDDLTCFTWRSVAEEVAVDCAFEPTEEDARLLQLISVIGREKANLVVAEQQDAVQASEQAQLTDESQYYEQISINQRLRQRSFERYADLVARTSRHNALTVAKQRQLLAVDASRTREPRTVPNYHATGDIANIGTTVFSGREVAVDSEPCEITGGQLAVFNAMQHQQQLRMQQEMLIQQQQQQTQLTMQSTATTLLAPQHSFAVAAVPAGSKSIGGSTLSLPINRRATQNPTQKDTSNGDVSTGRKQPVARKLADELQ